MSVETMQHYNSVKNKIYESRVGYIFTSFQTRTKNLYPNKSLDSPLSEKHNGFEFGIFLHHLKGLRVHLTPLSSCLLSQWKQYNTITVWRKRKQYESRVGYNFTTFQTRPINLYPNKSLDFPLSEKHVSFVFGQFLHTL